MVETKARQETTDGWNIPGNTYRLWKSTGTCRSPFQGRHIPNIVSLLTGEEAQPSLLTTDGSKEAGLALTTAADLAESTNSELHGA
jgi:hypothetical protein